MLLEVTNKQVRHLAYSCSEYAKLQLFIILLGIEGHSMRITDTRYGVRWQHNPSPQQGSSYSAFDSASFEHRTQQRSILILIYIAIQVSFDHRLAGKMSDPRRQSKSWGRVGHLVSDSVQRRNTLMTSFGFPDLFDSLHG